MSLALKTFRVRVLRAYEAFLCQFQFSVENLGHCIDLLSVLFIMQMLCSSTYYAILKTHRGLTVIITISETFRSGWLNIELKQGKNCTEIQYLSFLMKMEMCYLHVDLLPHSMIVY